MTTTPAFHVGDPYIKVDQGFARLPGAGYEALHPELKDVNPEDYPDIHKMAILADVAPYSREYQVSPSCLTQKPTRARAGGRRRCRHSPARPPVCPTACTPARAPVLRLSVCLSVTTASIQAIQEPEEVNADEVDKILRTNAVIARLKLALEQHFSPRKLGELWELSPGTIRSLFESEPGVIRIDRPEQCHKRGYRSMRIPESVAARVHKRLAA